MIVALFGDVHGNLGGMYGLCRAWEDENGEKIDLVLQTGDMGLFRTREELDTATRRLLLKDPTELGGAPYLSGSTRVPVETWFVHGNHENYSLLREREGAACDPGGRLIFLGTGSVRVFRKGEGVISVAAMGGMEYRFGKYPTPTDERIQKYLHGPSILKFTQNTFATDILLLHDAPLNKGLKRRFPTGSSRVTRLIEKLQPRFAFYGHYNDPPEPFMIGRTLCACLNHTGARRIPGRDGAMGILTTATWVFVYVE